MSAMRSSDVAKAFLNKATEKSVFVNGKTQAKAEFVIFDSERRIKVTNDDEAGDGTISIYTPGQFVRAFPVAKWTQKGTATPAPTPAANG